MLPNILPNSNTARATSIICQEGEYGKMICCDNPKCDFNTSVLALIKPLKEAVQTATFLKAVH